MITSATHVAQHAAGTAGTIVDDLVDAAPALLAARETTAAPAGVVDARRGLRALQQYQDLRAILAKDRSSVDLEDLRRLASFEADMRGPVHGPMQLPLPQRMSFGSLVHHPDRRHDIAVELDALQTWTNRVEGLGRHMDAEHARMRTDPSVTRAGLTAELRELLAREPRELTIEQLRRLATIETVPGHLRPGLPKPTRYSVENLLASEFEPGHSMAATDLRRIRVWAEQRAIMADRSLTGTVLRDEALAIAGRSIDDVTAEDMTRLAAIQGVSRARGVDMPGAFGRGRLAGLRYSAEAGWLPSSRGETRSEFAALQVWRDQVALDADPTVTRASLERELLELAIRPTREITDTDLRRIAAMDGMRGPNRPGIAPAEDVRDFRWLAVTRSSWSASAQVEIAKLRPREALLSDLGLELIADRVARGERVDAAVIAALADGGAATLARVGLDFDDLRRMSTEVLAAAGRRSVSEGDLVLNLQAARLELAEDFTKLTGPAAALRDETIAYADRNIARMLGERTDTYGTHPDYAEVGRMASSLVLLRAIAKGPAHPTPPTAGAEVLTW